jgi:hypothetical protein
VVSRDTTFTIGGISNFEVSKLKYSVKGHINSVLSLAKADFLDAFLAKPLTLNHMSAFENIVEESLNFNFGIQIFPRSVQNFPRKPQSKSC